MNNFKIHSLLLLIAIGTTFFTAQGQQNLTLYGMSELGQAKYLNPGFEIKNKFTMSLPLGFQNFYATNNGFRMNQLFVPRATGDSSDFKLDLAIKAMKDQNFIGLDATSELFSLGLKVGKRNFFSFSVLNKSQVSFHYPKDIFSLVFYGNGSPQLLGKRANLDGLGVEATSYMEYGVGFTRTINDKLTVGTRVKLLGGIANIHTETSQLGLTTDSIDFDLTLDGKFDIRSSNTLYFTDSNTTVDPSDMIGFKNKGFGLDFGASYKLTDKISLSASVIDLGFISWQANIKNYQSNAINYTFQGVNLNDFLNDSANVEEELLDTLGKIFNYQSNNTAYRTGLYTRFYVGGVYNLNKWLSASVTVYNAINQSKYTFGTAVGLNMHLKNWFSLSMNYSAIGRSANNVGFGIRLKAGPTQFYIMSDNVLVALNPSGAKNAHLSFGMNIVINSKQSKTEAAPASK